MIFGVRRIEKWIKTTSPRRYFTWNSIEIFRMRFTELNQNIIRYIPETVRIIPTDPKVTIRVVTMALNKISKCCWDKRDLMYSTNATSWHSPNVPKAWKMQIEYIRIFAMGNMMNFHTHQHMFWALDRLESDETDLHRQNSSDTV